MTNKLREPINSITHLAGALLSFIALIAMLVKVILTNPTFNSILSVTIFGICLILLYTISGTYHGIMSNEKVINVLQKLDHSMIFVLIAGSYAPYWFDCSRWLQTSMYIGMGWASIFMLKPLCVNLPAMSIFWLVFGGVLYTIGGIIYGAKPKKLKIGKFEFHEIFHIFIILGSLSHFISVFCYVI